MVRVLVLAALGAAVCLADDGTCEVAACSGPTSYANQVAALLSDYDKSMRPKLALGCEGADDIELHFEVSAITSVMQKTERVEMAGFFRVDWVDKR